MNFWRPHQSGPVFSAQPGEMLREAPTEQPKPSLCAGSIPREQRAQALTRLRDFCSHLTLHKVTAPARERGAEPGVTQPGDVLRGTEGGWRRERRLLDCEAIFQTCEEPFLFFYIFFPIDFQTASIYQCMKEIDYKRKIQSTRRWGWSHCRHSKHARTPWFSTALISQSKTPERASNSCPFHVTIEA